MKYYVCTSAGVKVFNTEARALVYFDLFCEDDCFPAFVISADREGASLLCCQLDTEGGTYE